jgi:ribonuclease J
VEDGRDVSSGPPASSEGTVRLLALGGLGEVGMNCLAIEQRDEVMLVDCGVTFPADDLGVDVVHPRFDWLLARKERLRGVVITHGHEDHIGALPYLLRSVKAPVFAPAHALELIRRRLREHDVDPATLDLRRVGTRAPYAVGSFSVEHMRVTHSIADATALAIRTDAGTVVHTGDFKLDPTPPDGELTDEARLAELGSEGVRLLLSDSTGSDAPGVAGSERGVGDALDALVARAARRVVIGLFASNVQRLSLLGDLARRHKRRLCLLGRSMHTHAEVARALGRLAWPSDLLVAPEQAREVPPERLLVLASGTQAEPPAALARLAAASHPWLRLDPGDTVILSSRIIPGNDRPVMAMMGDFLRLGVELVTRFEDRGVHVSGHAHRDEQARMIELTRPRAFLPVHGTRHHLTRHAAMARDLGVGEVLVAENGDLVELGAAWPPRVIGRAPVGRVCTQAAQPLADEVLRERARIGRGGMVVVALVLDAAGAARAAPRLVSRGVIDPGDEETERAAERAVASALEELPAREGRSEEEICEVARLAARRTIEARTGRRAVVAVVVSRT